MRSFVDHPNTAKELSIFGKDPERHRWRGSICTTTTKGTWATSRPHSRLRHKLPKKAENLYGFQMAWYERAVLSEFAVNKWFIFGLRRKPPSQLISPFSDDAMKAHASSCTLFCRWWLQIRIQRNQAQGGCLDLYSSAASDNLNPRQEYGLFTYDDHWEYCFYLGFLAFTMLLLGVQSSVQQKLRALGGTVVALSADEDKRAWLDDKTL